MRSRFLSTMILCMFLWFGAEAQSKLVLTSPDSLTTCRIRIGLQSSITHLNKDGQSTQQVSLDRARLFAIGQAFDPRLKYFFQLSGERSQVSSAPEDPNRTLLDGWLKFDVNPHFGVLVGQYMLPAMRQGRTGIFNLQFVARSLLQKEFSYGRDFGVHLYGMVDIGGIMFRPNIMYNTGEGRNNVKASNNIGNQMILRMEVLTGGYFKSVDGWVEGDIDREGHPKMMLAVSYDMNNDAIRQRGNVGSYLRNADGAYTPTDVRSIIFDAIFKYRGASMNYEYIKRDVDNDSFLSGSGYNAQVSYVFPNNYEIAFRNSSFDSSLKNDKVTERRIAINKYLTDHDFKVQAEYGNVKIGDTSETSFITSITVRI